jgi:hypothetical protein
VSGSADARVVVFTGPTLSPADARPLLDAEYRPPVAQGDVYRAAREKPWAIAIIDGHFEHVPAVWHKEILWALTQGIWVYGAASMGALRAAELARFGMIGVGAVFQAFATGVLERDDEVAVAETLAPAGALTASIALVDMRATLRAARSAGVIDADTYATLLERAKSTFYAERSYARLLADAELAGPPLAELRAWLPRGAIAQKRADALALLARIAADRATAHPFHATFHFQRTDMWHTLESSFRSSSSAGEVAAASSALLDLAEEGRLADPARHHELETRALVRALVSEVVRFEGSKEPAEAIDAATERFAEQHGLGDEAAISAWLAQREIASAAFRDAMTDDARLERLRLLLQAEVEARVLQELQLEADFPRLAERAHQKQELLARHGMTDPDPTDPRLPLEAAERAVADLAPAVLAGLRPGARARLVLREAWFRRLSRA